VNFASSLTALNNFMINTIIPIAELFIVTRLNTFIKKEFDERLYCKFEFDIISDPAQKTNDMKMLSERGAVTINELREQYNYDYVDDPRADELFIDKNEDDSKEEEPEAEEQPAEPENSNSENQTNKQPEPVTEPSEDGKDEENQNNEENE
jgi:hypothetical protein